MPYDQTNHPTPLADDEVHVWTVGLGERGEQGARGESGARSRDSGKNAESDIRLGHISPNPESRILTPFPDAPSSTLRAPCSTLSASERRQAERFLRADLRRRFVVAHAALRTILGRYLGLKPAEVPIEYGPHGKPRLGLLRIADCGSSIWNPQSEIRNPKSEICFNLSHSGELAVVAVTRSSEIGVDVERLREVRHLEQLAKRYFTPSETAAILAECRHERLDAASGEGKGEGEGPRSTTSDSSFLLPPSPFPLTKFFAVWTAKEAILKAAGTGLALPLSSFSVSPSDDPQRVTLDAADPAPSPQAPAPNSRCDWHLSRVDVGPGYLAAVATDAPKRLRPTLRYPDDLS